ncbi:uncharacterized protein LOC130645945 [Hydractinia symbiolongicarpus]|uniref:uncharacterized protein LOC130645945 n=1 Tax=Hydractinia symbiolongicarpus TaxID=13093 RepID=UPI00254A0CB8|nr:uncharacterized protein LOC130645945 [Hydractinia symbiolongicarpus]
MSKLVLLFQKTSVCNKKIEIQEKTVKAREAIMADTTEQKRTDSYIPWFVVTIFVESCLILILNGAAICIMLRKKLTKKLSNLFLLSLLISHYTVGLCACVFATYQLITKKNPNNKTNTLENWIASVYHTTFVVSFVSTISITVDRLTAIKLPFTYNNCTKSFFVYCFMIALILPLIYFTLKITHYDDLAYSLYIFSLAVAMVLLVVSNIVIHQEVNRQCAAIASTIVAKTVKEKNKQIAHLKKRQTSTLRICFFMVLSFILCWLPTSINCILLLSLDNSYPFLSQILIIQKGLMIVVFLNSLFAPIVHMSMNKDVKSEVKNIIAKKRKKVNYKSESTSTSQLSTEHRNACCNK